MTTTGYLHFGNEEVRRNIQSLSDREMNEFEEDLAKLLQKTNAEMNKASLFQGRHFANQRLGERNFRVELFVDLTPKKDPNIILKQFKELNIDDYLDSINNDKKLQNKGFIRLS